MANVVLVKKENGKWRLVIDFTYFNRACPNDRFPLPRIDLIVDTTAGHELLSFMDAFSGYNHIIMDPNDQEKTSFVIVQGMYCYQVMPFGLKNAGATYQRLVNKMFQKHIGASMEVYIDDMLVKSVKAEHHIAPNRIVPGPKRLQHEAKPSQVCFRSLRLKVFGFHSQQPRNRGKSRQNKSGA